MKLHNSSKIKWPELRELAGVFLKLGTTSFGGPVAHIAMMEDEVVTRRKWLERQHFLDLVGATNLIPGPNSTELAIHLGHLRAGWPGLLVAGVAFILPAVLIVLVLSYFYQQYGTMPQAESLFYGIKPVVIAIIAQALWKFLSTALKGLFTIAVALVAVALVVIVKRSEIEVIAIAAGVGIIAGLLSRSKSTAVDTEMVKADATASNVDGSGTNQSNNLAPAFLLMGGASIGASPTLWNLFLVFLKIGSIIYGSGYVLLAFLRADLVERYRWLTDEQLIDAVVIGQMTPGPVFTTATFVGYQIAGVSGAIVATLGIFLPSFLFVGLLSVMMDRLRSSSIMRSFLDAVNAASLALMAVVTYQLLLVSIKDVPTAIIAVVALVTLLYARLNSAWLIAAGAVLGFFLHGK